ncbi:hypothetical protein PtA15_1A687 [Puccinia triticina]|uniref:Uncharacterized protein n=1 Tax=Puccinia triticina TaxID=208348 RepID=A0ABY7CBQ6_9BASI|nr:uncharacterized protein PtA15_1A687 [Puccinia triticina]WAQ81347.1 hypothetical protein PtA15_1A687 [Puccinia triticina]
MRQPQSPNTAHPFPPFVRFAQRLWIEIEHDQNNYQYQLTSFLLIASTPSLAHYQHTPWPANSTPNNYPPPSRHHILSHRHQT